MPNTTGLFACMMMSVGSAWRDIPLQLYIHAHIKILLESINNNQNEGATFSTESLIETH